MDSINPHEDAIREGDPPYYNNDRRASERCFHSGRRLKWRSNFLEGIGCVMAIGGALVFGFGIFPFINPIQFRLNFGPAYLPASLFSFPVSIILMWIAWQMSQEAQRLRQQEETKE